MKSILNKLHFSLKIQINLKMLKQNLDKSLKS